MLHVCPECGYWLIPGMLQAMIVTPQNGVRLVFTCPDCKIDMKPIERKDRLTVKVPAIEAKLTQE